MATGTACQSFSALGAYPSVPLPDGRTELALGDLVSEEERIACFGVKVYGLPLINGQPPFDLKGELLLGIEILWDELSAQGVVSRTLTQQVRVKATQDPAGVVVNRMVVPWVSQQMAGAMLAEAIKLMDAGSEAEAQAFLDKNIQDFQQHGENCAEAIATLQNMKKSISVWSAVRRKEALFASYKSKRTSSRQPMSPKPIAPSSDQPPTGDGSQPKPS